MSTTMVVLTWIRHYLPGHRWGGPVRTLSNMVAHLSDELEFRIITSDRDALDSRAYDGIRIDAWNQVGRASVFYASPNSLSFRRVAQLIRTTSHDVVYLNSFFDPVFTLGPLMMRRAALVPRKPVVVAPRGEFSAGALALSRWKKTAYVWLARRMALYQGVTWQASSELEAEDIRRVLGPVPNERIRIAPNLPTTLVLERQGPLPVKNDAALRIVFLSRITPKKNLDFALRVLARVRSRVRFDVYGPIWDEEYWRQCRQLMNELPRNIEACYHGEVSSEGVYAVFADHDLFFFPTLGENFGHVILESLSAGTPVLISGETPWHEDGAGGCTVRAVGNDIGFAEAIEAMAECSAGERVRRREAAQAIARKFLESSRVVESNLGLFRLAASTHGGAGSPS